MSFTFIVEIIENITKLNPRFFTQEDMMLYTELIQTVINILLKYHKIPKMIFGEYKQLIHIILKTDNPKKREVAFMELCNILKLIVPNKYFSMQLTQPSSSSMSTK